MNIRCTLLVGVNDHLVDQLDQFVVAGGTRNIVATEFSGFALFIQIAQQVVNVA